MKSQAPISERVLTIVLVLILAMSVVGNFTTAWIFRGKSPSALQWMIVELPLCIGLVVLSCLIWFFVIPKTKAK